MNAAMELVDDSCWEWPYARDRDGYGVKTIEGRQYRAHRLAYEQSTGAAVPDGMMVLHSCDNPSCVRPSHLRVGTAAENAQDKVDRDRCRNQYTSATHCKYGHPFTDENTYTNPASGSRQCRTCRRTMNALDKRLALAPAATKKVLREIFRERMMQDLRWNVQNHPNGTGAAWEVSHGLGDGEAATLADVARDRTDRAMGRGECTYALILEEELAEAMAESDPARLRAELVQVAAVAVQWVEKLDRDEEVES